MGRKKKNKSKAKKVGGAAKIAGKSKEAVERLKFLEQDLGAKAPEQGMLERLDDVSPSKRQISCETIAMHLFQITSANAPKLCEFLVIKGTVTRLLQMLEDVNKDVATAAAKTLRNYCLVGGASGCEEVARLGMVARAPQLLAGAHKEHALFTAHTFAILANLCTHVVDAVDHLAPPEVLNNVFHVLEAVVASPSDGKEGDAAVAALEAASLLFVLSEDNEGLANQLLKSAPSTKVLLAAMQSSAVLDSTRSACAGVLVNLLSSARFAVPLESQVGILTPVFATLAQALEINPLSLASSMVGALSVEKKEWESKMARSAAEMKAAAAELKDGDAPLTQTQNDWGVLTQKRVFGFKQSAICLIQTLEILTNLSAAWAEGDEDTQQQRGQAGSQPRELHASLFSQGILPKVAAQLGTIDGVNDTFNPEAISQACREVLSQEETDGVLKQLQQARITAVACISNLVLHLPAAVTGDLSGLLTQACAQISELEAAYGQGKAHAVKEVDALAGLVWNVVRMGTVPTTPQLQVVLKVARGAQTEEALTNSAGSLGVIGQFKEHFPNNFIIGSVLLGMLESPNVGLETSCEVLNSIIDIYSEDAQHTAQTKQLKLVAKLAAYIPKLSAAFGNARGSGDEPLICRAEETLENLAGFVEYKRTHS